MKRMNGTGTVVKLSGSRRRPYVVRIPYRDKYGNIKQQSVSYHARAGEAQAALEEYIRHQAEGTAPAPDRLSMTVGEVYEAWSGREFKRLKQASVASHRAAWTKRVSRFAQRKMREVTLDEWQSILDQDEDEGRSQSLINNDALLIKALYAYSMERDIVGKDYSKYLDIPSVDPKRAKGAFDDLQLNRLERMAADGVPWADTVLMLCYTGFRISEFLGLTRFNYHQEGQTGYLQYGLKTDAGRDRIVPVHPKIQPYLMRWMAKGGETIITRDGLPVTSAWYRSTAFPPIAEALGAPEASPHWCRHTFVTRLHNVEVDALTIKWLAGHSTKGDVTNQYTHKTLEVLERAVLKLA